MVSDKTRELLRQQGPKVSDLTDPKSGKKEPDFADELLETKKKALKVKIFEDTMGGGKKDGERIETTLLNKAMDLSDKAHQRSVDQSDKANQRFSDETEKLRLEVDKLRLENQAAQQTLVAEQLKRVQEAAERAEAAARGNKGALETYQEVNTQLEGILASRPKPEAQHGMSDSTTLELGKLTLESNRLLEVMRQEAAARDREFQLQLLTLGNDKEFRLLEYKDKKDFRERAIGGLEDLAHAGKAAIEEERAKEGTISQQADTGATPKETTLSVTPMSFPCKSCGAKIDVPDVQGEQALECPECQAEYKVTPKAPA